MNEIEYNNILLDIIKRNGGSRRWPNLYIVEIDEYWDPLSDNIADWVKIDYRYTIYSKDTEECVSRKRDYAEPSYLAFYMDSVEIEIDHDTDGIYRSSLKGKRPHVALTGNSHGNHGVLRFQAMCCGDEFDSYPYIVSSKMMDRYEHELNEIIKAICPGSGSMCIEDNAEFEKQFCNLLDVIFGYTTVQRLISGSEIDLSSFAFDYVCVEDIEVDVFLNILKGESYIEDAENWQYFDYQHLCLLCIHAAINDLLNTESMYYTTVLQILKDHKVVLDEFTLWYLNNNESSIKEEDVLTAKEIIELCEET